MIIKLFINDLVIFRDQVPEISVAEVEFVVLIFEMQLKIVILEIIVQRVHSSISIEILGNPGKFC